MEIKEIESEIKKYEGRCVCTEEYYCNPCRRVEGLKIEKKKQENNK